MKTFKLRSKGLLLGLSLCSTFFLFKCGNDDKDTPTVLEVTADFEYSIDEETGATVTYTNKSENADTYAWDFGNGSVRSEEHTSELQSRETISYAVFCLKKKNNPLSAQIE